MELHPLAAGCKCSQALAAWDWHGAMLGGGWCIGLHRCTGLVTIASLRCFFRGDSRASPAPGLDLEFAGSCPAPPQSAWWQPQNSMLTNEIDRACFSTQRSGHGSHARCACSRPRPTPPGQKALHAPRVLRGVTDERCSFQASAPQALCFSTCRQSPTRSVFLCTRRAAFWRRRRRASRRCCASARASMCADLSSRPGRPGMRS